MLHDRLDHVERGRAVVDAAVAAPRLVGKQQRIGDVEVAVGRAIVAAMLLAGIAAAFDLVPGHQMRAGARRMVGAIVIHAVEGGLRLGIRAGHQRQRQHAVAMCLRDGDAVRGAAALHRLAVGVHLEEIASLAALLHDVKALPLPVEVDQRAVEFCLAQMVRPDRSFGVGLRREGRSLVGRRRAEMREVEPEFLRRAEQRVGEAREIACRRAFRHGDRKIADQGDDDVRRRAGRGAAVDPRRDRGAAVGGAALARRRRAG